MLKRVPRYSFIQEKFSIIFSKRISYIYFAIFTLLFFAPIFISNLYVIHTITLVLLYIVLAMGLNIIPGFTGLLDLGYVGFYAIGAYTAAVLTFHFGSLNPPWDLLANFWIIIPLAAFNGALWGILLGVPTLRLTGDYFAIVTFGFASLVELIIINEMWLTRGPMGIIIEQKPTINLIFLYPLTQYLHSEPLKYAFKGDVPFFYILFFTVVLTIFFVNRLENSRLGRAWFAIREDEIAAECSGINIMQYKVIAFAISASIGAVAGSLFSFWYKFVSPMSFKFWESILILCMVVLGGMGSIPGVILGATVIIILSEVIRVFFEWLPHLNQSLPLLFETWPQLNQYWEMLNPLWPKLVQARYLVFGAILIIMMRFKPAGLIPLSRVKREMRSKEKSIVDAMNESSYKIKSDEEKLTDDR